MFFPKTSPHAVPRGEIWSAPSTIAPVLPHWHTVLAVDVTTEYALSPTQLWPHHNQPPLLSPQLNCVDAHVLNETSCRAWCKDTVYGIYEDSFSSNDSFWCLCEWPALCPNPGDVCCSVSPQKNTGARNATPQPSPATQWVVSRLRGPRCAAGALAESCLIAVGTRGQLAVKTAPPVGVELDHDVLWVAPVLTSGWAVLGEPDKFVAVSPKRVTGVSDSASGPTVHLRGGAGEQVTIQFLRPVSGGGAGGGVGTIVAASITLDAAGRGALTPPPAGQ